VKKAAKRKNKKRGASAPFFYFFFQNSGKSILFYFANKITFLTFVELLKQAINQVRWVSGLSASWRMLNCP
jgi:hypothetical protein